jgi:hypothetical protein
MSFSIRTAQFFSTYRIFRPKPSDDLSEAFGQSVRSLRTFLKKPNLKTQSACKNEKWPVLLKKEPVSIRTARFLADET